MTHDEIIRMAKQAGFVVDEKARKHQPNCIFHTHYMVDEPLERFAAFVAAAEREACAKAAESEPAGMMNCDANGSPSDEYIAKWKVAAAIRARGLE